MSHQERLEAWLRLSARRLHEEAAALTALDQAIGDGDHGTNMDRGFGAIVAALDGGGWVVEGVASDSGPALAAILRGAGKTLISVTVPKLGPGASITLSQVARACTSGKRLTARVDPDDLIPERHEDNNTAKATCP